MHVNFEKNNEMGSLKN